jgi:hypothetical protein
MKKNQNFEIYDNGILEVFDEEFEVISEDEEKQTVKVIETDGQDANISYKINEESFKAEIISNNETYNLVGNRISGEDLLFKGHVNEKQNIKFEALLLPENKGGKKYKALVNIMTYSSIEDEEPSDTMTFSFDGRTKKMNTRTEKIDKTKKVISNGEQTYGIASSYYQYLTAYYGTYMQTAVTGQSYVRRDSGSNYQIRSTTKGSKISDYWRSQGYSIYFTEVAEYDVSFNGYDPSVFNAVDPGSSSETSYTVPMYFGGTIGTQLIPVKIYKISISNNGTDKLRYDTYWAGGNGYLDDRDIKSSTSRGFGAVVYWDTGYSMPTGYRTNSITTSINYRSRALTLTSGSFFYVFKRTSNSFSWGVNITN